MTNQNEQVKPLSLEDRKKLYEARLANVRQEFAQLQTRGAELEAMERELMGALVVVNELLAPEQADAGNKSAEADSVANPEDQKTKAPEKVTSINRKAKKASAWRNGKEENNRLERAIA